jgi:uncharacterized protein DUF4268
LIYKTYFQIPVDELRNKYKFTNTRVAQPYNWQSFSSGVSGFVYQITFSTGGLTAELVIDSRNEERNKAVYDWFHQQKDAIEAEMGGPLVWDQREGRRYTRIYAVRPNTVFSDAVTHADELRNWSIDHLLQLKKVFGPKLGDVLAATAPTAALETA